MEGFNLIDEIKYKNGEINLTRARVFYASKSNKHLTLVKLSLKGLKVVKLGAKR